MCLIVLVCGLVLLGVVGFLPTVEVFHSQQPIYQGSNARKWVAYTVNVDWGEEHLPEMLAFFNKNKIPVTFFITGRWAQENPELLKKFTREGFEIGNHGYGHSHVNNLSLAENIAEIDKTKSIIANLTQKETKFYAPPYGEFNDTVLAAAERTKHQTILWTVDTIDWENPPPEVIISRVVNKAHNGAIILMHPTASTVKALPGLKQGLTEQGYQVVPLEKLIMN